MRECWDAFASFFLEPNAMLAASNPLALMRAMTMHASQFCVVPETVRRVFEVFVHEHAEVPQGLIDDSSWLTSRVFIFVILC